MFKFGITKPNKPSNTEPGADSAQPQLLRLNHDFLQLLLYSQGRDNHRWRQQLALTSTQSHSLQHCSADALERMSACGFSLFCLSLHQPDTWQRIAQSTHANSEQRFVESTSDDVERMAIRLLECALFYVWHLAQQNPRIGRLSLALAEDTASVFKILEIWQCQLIAQKYAHLLTPRWRHNPYFWNDLLRYGETGEAQHFKFARVLGSQLIAQELEPSAIARLSGADSSGAS